VVVDGGGWWWTERASDCERARERARLVTGGLPAISILATRHFLLAVCSPVACYVA